ncbi:MAG: OmpA family protein [Solirubrobacteraceae bacterium]
MKKLNLIALFSLILSLSTYAQNANQKWAISFGAVATNHSFQGVGIFDQFFNTDYWSINAPLSNLKVSRYLSKGIVADLSAAAGKIDVNTLSQPASSPSSRLISNELFINAGLGIQLHPFAFIGKEESRIDPYGRIGVTYNYFDYTKSGAAAAYNSTVDKDGKTETDWTKSNSHVGPNFGAGINFWITKTIGLGLESTYNWILTPQVAQTFNDNGDFWQHSASLIFKLGKTDTDKDGILDKDDACPTVAGIAAFNGCPDTDADGLKDSEDSCPTVAGPTENKGCPYGDADSDTITDNLDKCPNEAGELANGGCPWGDADNDGVKDNMDKCPTVAGLESNNGCPVKTVNFNEEATKATNALQNLLFDTSKATIRPEGEAKLDAAAEIIKANTGKYLISGHTDSSGAASINNKLSAGRAAVVVKGLESRGVEKGRLVSKGFGSSNPISDNASPEGKQANRRVEVSALSNEDFAKMTTPVVIKKVTKKVIKKIAPKKK